MVPYVLVRAVVIVFLFSAWIAINVDCWALRGNDGDAN